MVTFVDVHENVLFWLKNAAREDGKFFRDLANRLRDLAIKKVSDLPAEIRDGLRERGLQEFRKDWQSEDCVDAIRENLKVRGGRLVVTNQIGAPLAPELTYGLAEWQRRRGSGENYLRTERFAQPAALQVGDILVTGERVISPPRRGYNSEILVHLSGGAGGTWLGFASRIALALFTPAYLEIGGMADNKCICPRKCDCQNPPPDGWDGKSGSYAISNYCPRHNENPLPMEGCPVHFG